MSEDGVIFDETYGISLEREVYYKLLKDHRFQNAILFDTYKSVFINKRKYTKVIYSIHIPFLPLSENDMEWYMLLLELEKIKTNIIKVNVKGDFYLMLGRGLDYIPATFEIEKALEEKIGGSILKWIKTKVNPKIYCFYGCRSYKIKEQKSKNRIEIVCACGKVKFFMSTSLLYDEAEDNKI